MWRSISTIFSTDEVSSRGEVTRFSTPRIMPSEVATYMVNIAGQYSQSCERSYGSPNPYGSGAEFDGFEGVFDLEETAFRREGATRDN